MCILGLERPIFTGYLITGLSYKYVLYKGNINKQQIKKQILDLLYETGKLLVFLF